MNFWRLCMSFNSIKVRLKVVEAFLVVAVKLGFQFHKGAIKRITNVSCTRLSPGFNSIKVRLKAKSTNQSRAGFSRFNSIKVRLKASGLRVGK